MVQTIENILKYLDRFEFTQNLEQDIALILRNFHKQRTFSHLQAVAKKALEVVNKDVANACWYYLEWMFENLETLGWQRHCDAVAAYGWLKLICKV